MHSSYMKRCLELAQKAASQGEVPVGAVIVYQNQIIAEGWNCRETLQSSIHHAEIIVIEKACKALHAWRLLDCELYVTLEPCIMCTGAILQSRISSVIFATPDPKGGACGSLYSLHNDPRLNHRFAIREDHEHKEESKALLKLFFKQRRSLD
jgi:tRNA(adenine34) deaminase